jgi:hypothetical protein
LYDCVVGKTHLAVAVLRELVGGKGASVLRLADSGAMQSNLRVPGAGAFP